MSVPRLLASALCLASLIQLAASAGAQEPESSTYDRTWAKAELYSGDDGSFFQSVRLSGRVQLDLAHVDAGDASDDEFNVRRFRLGFKTVFLRQLTLHVEADFNPQEADPLYTKLTDAYLAWAPSGAATVTLGKHSAGFTLDGMTSSKSLLTIDRSNLTNNIWFTDEYIPGLSVKGRKGRTLYHLGVFSSGDENREFGDFTGGTFVLATVGYDFANKLGSKEALLRLNVVDNEPDENNGFTRSLEHIGSLNFSYEQANWGVRADVSTASGYLGQSDLQGVMVMPFYKATDSVELVGRYTLVDSDDDNGVRFARYERSLVDGRGDHYEEIYFGLNYYWYGHKLKLQSGAQHADMKDRADDGGAYSGRAATTAIRVSW
jgi:phosphate-selective porin OprO/OprP